MTFNLPMNLRRNTRPVRAAGLAVAALLYALVGALPGVAHAQLDDPGLGPTPTSPTPAKTPPVTATPVKSPTFTPAAGGEPQGTLVSTDVKEETKTVPGTTQMTPDEWEARLVAPSLHGPVGLYHMTTAEVGNPLNFRVASHLQLFRGNSFLIAGSPGNATTPATPGDENSRYLGEFTLSLTGPNVAFLRNLEAYLTIFNASNQNIRDDKQRTDPSVILSLADVGWGLKGAWYAGKGISLGGTVGVRFFNSVSGVAAEFSATNVNIDALAMFDARKINSSAPLRIHVNLGYYVDNSLKLMPTDSLGRPQCFSSNSNDPCIRSRVVETFAYGVNTSRLRFAVGLELPFRPRVKWGYFGVDPFVEYHLEDATTDGDTVVGLAIQNEVKAGRISADRANNRLSQMITVGLRLRPVARLVLDAGVDFALQSPGFQYGPPLATYNVILGAAYTYGGENSQTKLITKTVTKVYEVNRRPPEGSIAGVVKDLASGKPVAGAIVTYSDKSLSPQSTVSDGTFHSYNLPPGPTTVNLTHPEYEPTTATANVAAESLVSLPVTMKHLPPKESKVHVRVVDNKENPLLGAAVKFSGPVTRDAVLNGEVFDAALPAGEYTLSVDANNFLARERQISVEPSKDKTIDIELTKRPAKSHVELTSDQIIIKGTIHFATNEAKILPDGQQLLDEVVDVLAKHPEVKKISIEGHTDNSGIAEKNLQLSKDRAAATKDYMISKGIAVDRLMSDGFGSTKPLVPNISPANKAKNRRVEFRIVGAQSPASSFPQ